MRFLKQTWPQRGESNKSSQEVGASFLGMSKIELLVLDALVEFAPMAS
jgi:hypothetical protein